MGTELEVKCLWKVMVKPMKSKRSLLFTTIDRKQKVKGKALSSFSVKHQKSVVTKISNTFHILKGCVS